MEEVRLISWPNPLQVITMKLQTRTGADRTVKDCLTSYVHKQTASRLLLKWLPFMQALQDTLVVIAIVSGTAVTLFAVNSVLADISKLLY